MVFSHVGRENERVGLSEKGNDMKKTVLVIDSDRTRLSEIMSSWHDHPWWTITATTLDEAIDILDDTIIDMIIAVEDLGWLSGADFLRLTHHRYPRMIRILIANETFMTHQESFSPCFHAEDHFHVVATQPYNSEYMTEIVHEMFGLEERKSHQASDYLPSDIRF